MKYFDEEGICDLHGCALVRMPQIYRPPYYVCPACRDEEALAPMRLEKLTAEHIQTLHELGAVKAELKKVYEQQRKSLGRN